MVTTLLEQKILVKRYTGNNAYLIGLAKHIGHPEERFRLAVTPVDTHETKKKTLNNIRARMKDYEPDLVLLVMGVNAAFRKEVLDEVVRKIDDATESGGWMEHPYRDKRELQYAIVHQMNVKRTQLRQ